MFNHNLNLPRIGTCIEFIDVTKLPTNLPRDWKESFNPTYDIIQPNGKKRRGRINSTKMNSEKKKKKNHIRVKQVTGDEEGD